MTGAYTHSPVVPVICLHHSRTPQSQETKEPVTSGQENKQASTQKMLGNVTFVMGAELPFHAEWQCVFCITAVKTWVWIFLQLWPGECIIGLVWQSSLHKHTKDCKLCPERWGITVETAAAQLRCRLIFIWTETVREMAAVSDVREAPCSEFKLKQRLAERSDAMSDVWQRGEQCHHGWADRVVLV